MRKRFVYIVLWLMLAGGAAAENEPVDTSQVPLTADSTKQLDSLSLPDSLAGTDSLLPNFAERYQEFVKSRERLQRLSFYDSVTTYFLSERMNMRSQIDRSYYYSAGDYFRSLPSYVLLEHQVTPMRTTVQPFGVMGNRLALLSDGNRLEPREHLPEPDGLVDLNDIPTALDDAVYILPGAAGYIFGGDGTSLATLLTRHEQPTTFEPHTALLADKGSFDYSYLRGRYVKKFTDSRDIAMSIGYRKAYGPTVFRKDDAYHYYGDFFFPLGWNSGFRAWGRLYDREGNFVVRPDAGGGALIRKRFDRAARLSYEFHNDDHTRRYEVGYRHHRNGSYLSTLYSRSFNFTGHGGFVKREWAAEGSIYRLQGGINYDEYDDGPQNKSRLTSRLSFAVAHLQSRYRWALRGAVTHVSQVGILPAVSGTIFRETPRFFFLGALGYSERAPSMLELNLPFQQSSIYGANPFPYAEEGNSDLKRERQIVASLTVELGSPRKAVEIACAGGKIFDAIDWNHQPVTDSLGGRMLFSPVNRDITFFDVRLQPKYQWKDFLSFVAGGAYHYLDYENLQQRAYSPAYQCFSGLELHVYWRQRLLDLFAYGEIVYTGPYDGYEEKDLGGDLIANAKLSFALKDFRFNFVFQDVLSHPYRAREYITFYGRYFYYTFTWNFLN